MRALDVSGHGPVIAWAPPADAPFPWAERKRGPLDLRRIYRRPKPLPTALTFSPSA